MYVMLPVATTVFQGSMAESAAKKKRKSMRRSSFVRGRISMAVTAMSTPR